MFRMENDQSDLLEKYGQVAAEQITGFKRCHLASPIYIDYASPGFINLIGYSLAELHDLFNDESVRFVHPDDAEEYQRLLNRFSQNEMTATFHYRVICKNGEVKMLTDTMKSVMVNGVMWGFSSVSDSTSVQLGNMLSVKIMQPENTLLSLSFDMDTRRRIASSTDVAPHVLASDMVLDDIVADLRTRVNYRYRERFDEFANNWHLRERLSIECLMVAPEKEESGKYRWMSLSTVCLPDVSGRRVFNISIADIDDKKCLEIKNTEGDGLDWLTGLLSLFKFHETCLEMGLSDDSHLSKDSEKEAHFSSLYSDEFNVMVAASRASKSKASRLQDGRKCAMVAVGLRLKCLGQSGLELREYWKQLKLSASALRLMTREDTIITRADSGLFLMFSNQAADQNVIIERARIFKAAMTYSLGLSDSSLVSIGAALCNLGEQYDNALSCAIDAMGKASNSEVDAVVVSELGGQDYYYDAASFDMKPYKIASGQETDLVGQDMPLDSEEDEPFDDSSDELADEAIEPAPRQIATEGLPKVRIRTFGYFEVFVDDQAVMFPNAKAKELLALLVDHRGGYVMPPFAISRLWESECDNKSTRARYRKTALKLRQTLEEYGISHIIDEKNGKRRIATEYVDCDLYKHRQDDCPDDQRFRGTYLPDYSWGELTLAQLLYESVD